MSQVASKVAIVGLGLIGGSIGMALTQNSLVQEIVGIDICPETLELGEKLEAVHLTTDDLKKGITDADIVIFAVPVRKIPALVQEALPYFKPGAIITDVGSTKHELLSFMEQTLPAGVHYIGGHPMAGSEKGGIQAADPYLFENAFYILTPNAQTDREALDKLTALVKGIGAKPIYLNAGEHDLITAAISHLPHIVAACLVNNLQKAGVDHEPALALAAGGFKDTTRIAAGDPVMWRDICLSNKDKILAVLQQFKQLLQSFEDSLQREDSDFLTHEFAQARKLRLSIPEKVKGLLPKYFELVVHVADRPGVFATIATILGNAGINIADIEILRVREGEEGSIRLGFHSDIDLTRSLTLLQESGFRVQRKIS